MPEVESPDEKYSVSVQEVWEVADVPEEARTVGNARVIQAIKEAMIEVEDAAADDTPPQNRETVVLSRASMALLENNGEAVTESMSALDVSISYDVEANIARLDERTDRLMDAIKPKGEFVFRSL